MHCFRGQRLLMVSQKDSICRVRRQFESRCTHVMHQLFRCIKANAAFSVHSDHDHLWDKSNNHLAFLVSHTDPVNFVVFLITEERHRACSQRKELLKSTQILAPTVQENNMVGVVLTSDIYTTIINCSST